MPASAPPGGSGHLVVRGAREHNLKNIHLELPRDSLIVFTGISGSGKSSLAFDTIYAEGQRRYVESLSAYARQFLGQMDKPDVDFIEGLSPAISIDQKSASKNPRSTVGTITEVYDYLRLLFARIGVPHCPDDGAVITRQTPQQIVDRILELPEGTRFQVLAPVVRGRKGEYESLLADLGRQGYTRARVDGEIVELTGTEAARPRLARYEQHTIEVVAPEGEGESETLTFSQHLACAHCGLSFDELAPRNFSFNSPYGACERCDGLGTHLEVDSELVIPNPDLSLEEGAIAPWSGRTLEYFDRLLSSAASAFGFRTDVPWKKLSKKAKDVILFGSEDEEIHVRYKNRFNRTRSYWTVFEGVITWLERRHSETDSDYARERYEQYFREVPCPTCKGARLRQESLAVTIGGRNIFEICEMGIDETDAFLRKVELNDRETHIAERVLKEIHARLGFLLDVGLDYLTLSRGSATLAGGEAQRIRLATQIGSGLVGVLYVLDEPSIGLHQRDNH